MGRKGKTPVDGGYRKKVSVIGAVRVSPAAHRLGPDFDTLPDGYFTAESVAAVLRDLLKHLRGKARVVWDGGGHPKGPAIRDVLRRDKRLTLERSPAYAPDLDPVEAVWSWLRSGRLANYVPDGIPALDTEVVDRLIELACDPDLLRALWDGSDLPFPKKGRRTQGSLPAGQ